MKIKTEIKNYRIKISEPMISDIYYIEQSDANGKFYVISDNGYNGYEGGGYDTLEAAIRYCKHDIKNYFRNRCEPNPTGF